MKKIMLLLLALLPVLASAQPVKSSGIIYYDSIPDTKPSLPYGSEVAYSRAFAKFYRFNLVADDWEEMKGGTISTTDSTSFVVYKASHGYNLASYPGEVIAVKADYTVAYASTVGNTQVGYVVGTPHPDSIELQFSGLLHRHAHGLPPGKEYFLQDIPSGLSDTIPGTVVSRTFIVVDSNYLFLSEVGAAQDYDIPVVNIPAVYITGFGGDPVAPHDTIIQKVAELFAEVGRIKPGSYLVTNNTTISDNPTYQAAPDAPTTPSAGWVWNGEFVTRIKELVADVDLQDTLYGGLGTSVLTPLLPAGSEPTTAEVATWYQNNFETNGLQLANGAKVYWVGNGTQSNPDLIWEVQDDLSYEGGTKWERIVKRLKHLQTASEVSFTPGIDVLSTNVQSAIEEVQGNIPGVQGNNVFYVSTNGNDSTAQEANIFRSWYDSKTASIEGEGVDRLIHFLPGNYIVSETGTDYLTYDNSNYETASLIPNEQGVYNLYFQAGAKVDMQAASSSFYPGAFYIPNDSTTYLNIYGEGDFELSNSQYNSLFWLGNDAQAYIRGRNFTIEEEPFGSQYSAFNRNAVRKFDFKCDYFYHAGVDFVSSYQLEDSADYRIEVDDMVMIADAGGDNSSPRIWLHYGRPDLDTVEFVREHYYIGSLGYDYESVGSPFCTPIFIGGSGKRGLVKNYEGSLTIDRFDLLDEKDFSIRYETEIAGFIERPEDGDTSNDDVIFDKTRIYKDSRFDIDIGTINSRQTQGYYCNSIFDNTEMTIRIDEAFVESMAIVFTDLQVTNNSTIIVDCGYCQTFDRQTLIFSGSIDATSKVIIRGTYESTSPNYPVFSINQTGAGKLILEDVTLLSTGDTTVINSYTGSSKIHVKNLVYDGLLDDSNTVIIEFNKRAGVATITGDGDGEQTIAVTFTEAMPDDTYDIKLTPEISIGSPSGLELTSYVVSGKTPGGFTISLGEAIETGEEVLVHWNVIDQ